jgi:hypothetical protein
LLLLNAAAARAVSFILSPRLIIFSPAHNAAPTEYFGWAALLTILSPAPLVFERPEAVLLFRAKLLFVAAKNAVPLQLNMLAGAASVIHGRFPCATSRRLQSKRCVICSRMTRANEAKISPKSSVMACPCESVEGCDELLSAPFHAAPSKWKLGKSKRSAG